MQGNSEASTRRCTRRRRPITSSFGSSTARILTGTNARRADAAAASVLAVGVSGLLRPGRRRRLDPVLRDRPAAKPRKCLGRVHSPVRPDDRSALVDRPIWLDVPSRRDPDHQHWLHDLAVLFDPSPPWAYQLVGARHARAGDRPVFLRLHPSKASVNNSRDGLSRSRPTTPMQRLDAAVGFARADDGTSARPEPNESGHPSPTRATRQHYVSTVSRQSFSLTLRPQTS